MVVENNSVINCPLCHKQLYSEIGKECKMCGMVLDDGGKDFCSETCRTRFIKIMRRTN